MKVSFVNHFLLKLITCPAGSDGSPVVLSIVLCSLTKFLWLVLWSWRRQLVGHFLVDLGETQRLCSHFFWLRIYVASIYLCFSIVSQFLRLFQQFISFLSLLFSCWCLPSFTILVFELFLDRMFPCLYIQIVGGLVNIFFRVWFYWFYSCWCWFYLVF